MAVLKCKGLWSVSVATLVAFGASATWASDQTGDISDPEVISDKRFSDDVSAFYLGVTAGYGGGGDDRFGLTTPTDTFAIGDQDISGSYGGVRGGWRGVLPARGGRDYVYGFELGYDFGSLDDSVTTVVGSETVQGGSEVSDIVTLRFRNGLTNRSGRILYFVSVGYVWGDVETTNSISSTTGTQSFEASDRRNGFSLSIGAEHYLTENWSITGEYEYVQFDSKDIEFSSGFSTKSTPNYRGLRFGLNYKF
ncbi:porin family protein [Ruegeria sp. R13_0]|uniref:outer membrane protein n=1 Tax=Ruegeria sp. R13_0 TaxID=2821099 RepID=UPI001AD99C00|nr:porin family protein [Ruegeria sp. R13_0]